MSSIPLAFYNLVAILQLPPSCGNRENEAASWTYLNRTPSSASDTTHALRTVHARNTPPSTFRIVHERPRNLSFFACNFSFSFLHRPTSSNQTSINGLLTEEYIPCHRFHSNYGKPTIQCMCNTAGNRTPAGGITRRQEALTRETARRQEEYNATHPMPDLANGLAAQMERLGYGQSGPDPTRIQAGVEYLNMQRRLHEAE